MRKLLSVFLIAVSVLSLTSCEEMSDILNNEEMAPELTFKAKTGYITDDATVTVGDEVKFSWEVVALGAKLQSFTIRLNNQDLTPFPNEDVDRNEYQDEFTYLCSEAGSYTFVFIATDKDDLKATTSITVKVEEKTEAVVELEAAVDFQLGHPAQTDFPKTNDVVGIEYSTNTDGNTAKFVATSSNKFVVIADASLITNKQELADAYDNGEANGVAEFTANSDANFVEAYYATKVSDVVYLVKSKNLTFAAGANKAYFSYQK